jgi:hypothetical protein
MSRDILKLKILERFVSIDEKLEKILNGNPFYLAFILLLTKLFKRH